MRANTLQRGSGWSIRLVFFLYRLFGYSFVYYLMYPVTFFYFLVANNAKIALKEYYQNIGKKFTFLGYYHHLRYFALCMCDRFISRLEFESYKFEIEGDEDVLIQTLQEGCVLLLSHFGGWAAASNCFPDYKINIVMNEVMLDAIKKIEEELPPLNSNLNIINLSSRGLFAPMEAVSALLNGEILAMMADRSTKEQYNKSMRFFGKKANFNKNPFYLAGKTEKPLLAIMFIHHAPREYKIEFKRIESTDAELEVSMRAYVEFLEKIVSKNPEQWFNFYHFWKEEV